MDSSKCYNCWNCEIQKQYCLNNNHNTIIHNHHQNSNPDLINRSFSVHKEHISCNLFHATSLDCCMFLFTSVEYVNSVYNVYMLVLELQRWYCELCVGSVCDTVHQWDRSLPTMMSSVLPLTARVAHAVMSTSLCSCTWLYMNRCLPAIALCCCLSCGKSKKACGVKRIMAFNRPVTAMT